MSGVTKTSNESQSLTSGWKNYIDGKLQENRYKIGQGVALMCAIAAIIGLCMASVGGDTYDGAHNIFNNTGDVSAFNLAKHIRDWGIALSVLGGLGCAKGLHMMSTAPKTGEEEDSKTFFEKYGNKITMAKAMAVFLMTLFLVGVVLASTGGSIFETAKNINYGWYPDSSLIDLGHHIRDAGIALSVLCPLGAYGLWNKSREWEKQKHASNRKTFEQLTTDTSVVKA